MLIIMILFGLLTLASAFGVVLSKRSLHSALCLVATMFLIAIHFALLNADFLAALQIMIYAGAIMVLVVFVIMLLGLDQVVDKHSFSIPKAFSFALAACFVGLICYAASSDAVVELSNKVAGTTGAETAKGVGRLLLTDYFFAFQVIALLLLAAIVGAVVLAQDKRRPLASNRGLSAMHTKDLVGED